MKYVVYEVWTTARIIEADNESDAYLKGEPPVRKGLNLSNWHAVPLDEDNLDPADRGQELSQ